MSGELQIRHPRTRRSTFTSWAHTAEVVRSQVWAIPAVCVAVAVGLAIGLTALDRATDPGRTLFLFPGPASGARSFLSSITQAMISFTGVVFSVTIVVLQLSSSQFSPRVLRRFLQSRTIQVSLGVFVATFVYSMVVLREVKGGSDTGFVPRLAVTGALLLVVLSVGMFIRYIAHVTEQIRVATVIASIGDETRGLLEPCGTGDKSEEPRDDWGPPVELIAAPESGVLVSINHRRLVDLAGEADCTLRVRPRVGDFVPEGSPFMAVHRCGPAGADPQTSDDWAGQIVLALAFDRERTMEQDVAFGLRQLVDIAERALSPSVNDPTTACQAIDQIHDILRRLAARPDPDPVRCDTDGTPRLVLTEYTFADQLDFVVRELWRYGADAAQVPGRLSAMLTDLQIAGRPERQRVLAEWVARTGA